MVVDPIANMLTCIKNAGAVRNNTVSIPYSNLKYSIAEMLKKNNYVKDVEKKGKQVQKEIKITVSYKEDGTPKICGIERVSKPSKRVYVSVKEIKPVCDGRGLLVISTPKGILNGMEARKVLVGGEVLFKIW